MAYRKYKWGLIFRVGMLLIWLSGLAFAINQLLLIKPNLSLAIIIVALILVLIIYSIKNLLNYTTKRFYEMDDFFESTKYKDFSRWYPEQKGAEDIRTLHKGFNAVNKTIITLNKEKEAQHLYLKKILELIDTGIIAFNVQSGAVLWVNDAFKNILNLPSFKSVQFVEKRHPDLFHTVFTSHHNKNSNIDISVNSETLKILISSAVFHIKEEQFKLVVLQNIDDTLNRTESEAWKKLLSVMTHEIMNSIAPISSLADTLQSKVQSSLKDSSEVINMNDLDAGIESIKKRSEGLLRFAKTYRSLNKVTTLNLSSVLVNDLFENIKLLMQSSLESKNIELQFKSNTPDLQIEIDRYLIEQVLINLILNGVEACKNSLDPKITVTAEKNINGHSVIKVTDNGSGIPENIIDNVFVPFFSTKKKGSGVGLSLSKQIMLLHNGKIQIRSKERKGTSVQLVF
ncbi:PAS domain-containing sensor histidine kinase [Aestuariivivens sp. NBU2969]|uniref:sensor histidine kinase n=1 Tax=Aestuariivivens sp. NBU2969 TaxID=2873267 RepID=UPI001CBF555C|nr:ATP-binding protein [Aestuariivivens sp. NBU2969]